MNIQQIIAYIYICVLYIMENIPQQIKYMIIFIIMIYIYVSRINPIICRLNYRKMTVN